MSLSRQFLSCYCCKLNNLKENEGYLNERHFSRPVETQKTLTVSDSSTVIKHSSTPVGFTVRKLIFYSFGVFGKQHSFYFTEVTEMDFKGDEAISPLVKMS